MNPTPLYKAIASTIDARKRCATTNNSEWFNRHSDSLAQLAKLLPSGSGFDSGTEIDLDRSSAERLVFHTSFHHMDEYGSYDGWTTHTVTVKPSLLFNFTLRVSGHNRNDIREYIAETFDACLGALVTWTDTDGYIYAPEAQ
jgi:hypothetical protein